ncbi:type VII secretion protein EssA [Salirhabdus sp. Marseille-P4669]|uniref:type VII secretion protein EssA n=1 Tax=Salirhabdus sp. Marseille-P4669 TaxID=2042310 RepID=UPI000C79993E|nr:type VII secretion protein EssA [Salirhabdus sp. Marseille-P4669]
MKRLSILMLFSLLTFQQITIHAEEPDPVQPHIYEEKKIEINTNSFREQNQAAIKQELPEEQKNLTFIPNDTSKSEIIQSQLFTSVGTKTNSITTQAQQIGLFDEEVASNHYAQRERVYYDGSVLEVKHFLWFFTAIVIGFMFFWIIPKLRDSIQDQP